MNAIEQLQTQRERIVLAARDRFTIGNTQVDPPLRTIQASETATLEPRVMQVLVALNDADGGVLSRDRLIDLCWAGILVGDDAINRAVAELRRAGARIGADFEVETIPKVGYRLKTNATELRVAPQSARIARRTAIASSLAVAGSAALGGILWSNRAESDPRADALLNESRRALRTQLPADNKRAILLLEEATKRSPGSAVAAGLLAVAWRDAAEFAPSDKVSFAVQAADRSARAALAIDPHEGNALTALATLQPYMGDWKRSADRLNQILQVAPDTLSAVNHLVTLYQSSGYMRLSKQFNDQAMRLDPLSPIFQFRNALKHWIFGDIDAADLTIDRVLQVWPRHPAVWNARLMLYAYTGRPDAALALLDNRSVGPATPAVKAFELWRISLAAIASRDAAAIERAVAANLAAVRHTEGQAATSLMTLSTLGRLDDAFALARGYFLGKGPALTTTFAEREVPLLDQFWKRSMMLFTPATLAMRNDPRFAALCGEMGLATFWQESERKPDFREFDRVKPSTASR